jgi:hypothetical protein
VDLNVMVNLVLSMEDIMATVDIIDVDIIEIFL